MRALHNRLPTDMEWSHLQGSKCPKSILNLSGYNAILINIFIRESAEGMATRKGPNGSGLERRWGRQTYTSPRSRDPTSLLYDGYRSSFLRVMRSRRGNHSPLSSAEIGNEWRYTSTPPLCLHGVYIYLCIQYAHFQESHKQWFPN